jgi:hypothetical protein
VARQYGLEQADRLPLPRLTRAEREDLGMSHSGFRRRS